MRRWRILLLVAATLFVAAAGVLLWQLPEIVRRVAVARIPELTGRAVSIDDIDLNLFTGRVALKGFRMAEREGSEAFVKFDRLDARLFLPSIVLLDIRLSSVSLTGLEARLIRTAPDTFNFSDIIERLPKPDPNAKPGRLSVTLDHVALARSKVTIVDRAVTPAADWSLQSLDAEASGFSTDTRHAPAEASVRLKSGEASVEFQKIRFKLQPFATSASIKVAGFDATRLKPYIADPEVTLGAAVVSTALDVSVKRDGPKLDEAWAAGDVTVEGVALSHVENPGRFLGLKRFHARIDKADALARAITLAQVEVESPDVGMVRRPNGQMDILIALQRLIQRRAEEERARRGGAMRSSEAPEGAPAAPPEAPWLVRITDFVLTGGKVTLSDETVTPPAQWHMDDLAVKVTGYSIAPTDPPATAEVQAHVTGPGRGNNVATLDVAASSLRTAAPFAGIAQVKLTDFDLRAIRPYVAQQIGIEAVRTRGKLSVDLRADIARQEGAAELERGLVSGTVRLENVGIVPRGERKPMIRLPKLALGIKQVDLVARSVALDALEIEGLEGRITREASGEVDVVTIADRVKGEALAGPKGGAKAVPGAAPDKRPTEVAAAPPAAPRGPPPPPWRVSLDRLSAKNGIGIFEDEMVSPVTTLTVNDIMLTAKKLLWPTVR